jgi:glycosyltransferase involved in cell wall biosynthesis
MAFRKRTAIRLEYSPWYIHGSYLLITSDMKRIAFISEHASPLGGAGSNCGSSQHIYVAELALALAASGHLVDIYTRREDPGQPEIINWAVHVRVIHIQAGPLVPVEKEGLLGYMKKFADNMLHFIVARQLIYEVIHAHFFMSALVASLIKKTIQTPYVVTFHALGPVRKAFQKEMDRFPPERFDIERFIVQDADRLLAGCPQDKEDLVQYYGADAGKISIVPCGFNPREFFPVDRNEARQRLGLPAEIPILLQLGRMAPRKGVDTVIRALGRLRNLHRSAKLFIVGGNAEEPDPVLTPEIGRLQGIARDLDMQEQVVFTGRSSRGLLRYFYSAADIFITAPWYEPFGITPLEAMACGVPVVGSDTGGIKYSVLPGKTGYLVTPKDDPAFATAIDRLLTDKKLRSRMGKNGLQRVQRSFTWEKVAKQVAEIYTAIQDGLQKERLAHWPSAKFNPCRPAILSPLLSLRLQGWI